MEVLLFIVGSVFLIILITGYFGIGIKASLINEIRRQAYMGSVATLKSYPSISIEEAYNALSSYDTTGKGNSIDSFGKWSFWVLVNGSLYVVLIKKESFSSGIKLLVTSGEDYIDRMNNNYLYVNNKFIEEYDLIPSDIKSILLRRYFRKKRLKLLLDCQCPSAPKISLQIGAYRQCSSQTPTDK